LRGDLFFSLRRPLGFFPLNRGTPIGHIHRTELDITRRRSVNAHVIPSDS
jgi:hypothetical protein